MPHIKPHSSGGSHPPEPNNNPFNSMLEGQNSTDEWWNEESPAGPPPSEVSAASRVTLWPRVPERTGLGLYISSPAIRVEKRHSVQRPIRNKSRGRQRKQNARAGIKVVTDFARNQPTEPSVPVSQQAPTVPAEPARFVQLEDLQALKDQPTKKPDRFWRSRKDKVVGKSRESILSRQRERTSGSGHARNISLRSNSSRRRPTSQRFSSLELGHDLSPNDRPIPIGISIPSSELTRQVLDPQTATSEATRTSRLYEKHSSRLDVPETPTILITPADQSSWARPESRNLFPNPYIRPASSVYSYATNAAYLQGGISTSPQIPFPLLGDDKQRKIGQESYFSPDSDDVTTWEDDDDNLDSASTSRRFSSGTVFEEDESPIIARAGRAVSISAGSKLTRLASTSTVATRRRSRGWWNYITTPFLSRSGTLTTHNPEDQQRPALPSLAIAAIKAQEAERDKSSWEKQFSPATPKTSTTAVSDSWWDTDVKHPLPSTKSPVLQETRHKVQTSISTLGDIEPETVTFASTTVSSVHDEHSSQLNDDNTSVKSQSISEANRDRNTTPTTTASNPVESPNNHPEGQRQLNIINNFVNVHQIEGPANGPVPTSIFSAAGEASQSPSAPPPPYSPAGAPASGAPPRVRYRAVFPAGHPLATQYPVSPGPLSPGMREAMSSRGAIPMSDVPLTPPLPACRPINLNPGYTELPAQQNTHSIIMTFPPPPSRAKKAEAKRRRYEKEEAIARKAGGLWRGRGCVSDRGCYGRSGAEGRKRRRWYLGLTVGFLLMIALVVVLATTLHRKSSTAIPPTQWLNLTGFPPIYLGLSTIIAPVNIKTDTGCVFPATQWSCDLPKELQASVSPNQASQPNFILEIQWDNSSSTNATFRNVTGNPTLITRAVGGGPVSAGQFIRNLVLQVRQAVTFVPSPTPPSYAEDFFLGNTTDEIVSESKAGEPTPFYISLLSTIPSTVTRRQLTPRDDPFPNVTATIPAPSLNPDGTAAPANLLPSPLPTQQPIRLYDRGLPTEHYGFYTYFDRTIFLKSLTLLNDTNIENDIDIENGEVPDDENGGATESEAAFRCTWSQTRFLVQMWTRMNTTSRLLNATSIPDTMNAVTDLAQPGTFPYPTTITTDRHGGDPRTKMVYCYDMNDREGIVAGSGKINEENRAFGGTAINPAPGLFANVSNVDTTLGGYDGGTGGCSCQWSNFQEVVGG